MRRTVILCILALLVCSAAYPTNYVWNAGLVTKNYNDATAWTPAGIPNDTSDALFVGGNALKGKNGAMDNGTVVQMPYSGTVTLGEIVVDNALFRFDNSSGTLRLVADNGQSGDFIIRANGTWGGYGGNKTFDIDGDFYIEGTVYNGWSSYSPGYSSLVMRGSGTTFDMQQDGSPDQSWNTVTIESTASVTAVRTPTMKNLIIHGTIAGGVWTVLPSILDPSDIEFGSGAWTGGELVIANVADTAAQYVNLGGGTYPKITVNAPNSYDSRQTIRLKGDVTVTNDFAFMKSVGYYASSMRTLLDTDNGSGVIHNLSIGGNLDMDGVAVAGTNHWAGIKANSATIDVNGNATFGRYAYIKGGTSTWKFGGNVSVTNNFRFDNTDMTGATVYIDGAGNQAIDVGNRVPVLNVVVNKSGGVTTLNDNVLLLGNLTVLQPGAGLVITNEKDGFILAGGQGEATAQEIDAQGVDLITLSIVQGSISCARLMSDLDLSDNLNIATGCKLFLNGYTLNAEGTEFISDETGIVSWDQGQIIGTIPEPGTLLLLGTGVLGVLGYIRRRRMS